MWTRPNLGMLTSVGLIFEQEGLPAFGQGDQGQVLPALPWHGRIIGGCIGGWPEHTGAFQHAWPVLRVDVSIHSVCEPGPHPRPIVFPGSQGVAPPLPPLDL